MKALASICLVLGLLAPVHGSAQTRLDPLFGEPQLVAPRPPAEIALEAFAAKVVAEQIAPGTALAPLGLTLAAAPIGRDRLQIIRFDQTYRGVPVHGEGGQITVVLRDGEDLVLTRGTLVDPERSYIGLSNPSGVLRARRAMRRQWVAEGGQRPFRLTRPELVALPHLGRMAYRATVWQRSFARSRDSLATILVDARSGALITLRRHQAEAEVLATRIDDAPRSMTLTLHGDLPSKQIGPTLDFSDPEGVTCNGPWTPARMGDARRMSVLSFEGSGGDAFAHFTTARCLNGGEAPFLGASPGPVATLPLQVYAQDLFVKTQRAMAAMDPLMGALQSHGAAVPYAWDHHPAVNGIQHRAPLVLVVNASSGWFTDAPGKFKYIRVHEQDAEALDLPVPHPLVVHCRDVAGTRVDCPDPAAVGGPMQDVAFIGVRAQAPLHTNILFHELGHYYDQYASFGLNGEMAEILAQVISLYLMVKVYALDHQLTGLDNGSCELNFLITHSPGVVVHPDCVTDLDQVSRQIEFIGTSGRTVQSFTQGFWSLLWGVSCEITAGVLSCQGSGQVDDTYHDRWMAALLFALHLGNDLTPVELWDAIALYIDTNFPQDSQTLARVRALHGLQ
ncbi:MAG: hypothetical protein AAFY65_00705 [Pseudomonadota bacterium]